MLQIIGTLAYVSIITPVVALIIYKRERSIFLQKISYLNRRITSENRFSFKMGELYFKPTYKNNLDFVNIKESNMENPDYARVVKKYRRGVLIMRISIIIAVFTFLISTYLMDNVLK